MRKTHGAMIRFATANDQDLNLVVAILEATAQEMIMDDPMESMES
jgi:hypothetical protein